MPSSAAASARRAIADSTSRPCSRRCRFAFNPERDEPRAASSSLSCGSFMRRVARMARLSRSRSVLQETLAELDEEAMTLGELLAAHMATIV